LPLVPDLSGDEEDAINPYRKDPRGRKPKKSVPLPGYDEYWKARKEMVARHNGEAGTFAAGYGHFHPNSSLLLGSHLDLLGLAHGAVGCNVHALTERLHPPGFIQGIDTFTAHDFCTDLHLEDLDDNGNQRLRRAIAEAEDLFPLARGIAVLNEEPVGLIGTDINGILKARQKDSHRFFAASSYGLVVTAQIARRATIKTASSRVSMKKAHRYDVALTHIRRAGGLVWLAAKLLRAIGLNPIHAFSGSGSIEDIGRLDRCQLIIVAHHFTEGLPAEFHEGSIPHNLLRLFGMPLLCVCFCGPTATDESLRRIAARFDWSIQRRVERVIAEGRRIVDAVIECYRPRLEGKLVLNLGWSKEQVECFHLLGMRVGDRDGWPGKTGVRRVPRLAWKWPDEDWLEAYIAEAKPDLVIRYAKNETEWHKRGIGTVPFSSLYDTNFGGFWGYDGFAALAATLDRHINAPWRKLVKPPWPRESG